MVKKSHLFLIFIVLIWITPVWSGQYDLIVQKNLFSPQRQEESEENQNKPPNSALPIVIGLWKQKGILQALIIAPDDPKQIPKWYLIGEEIGEYKILDMDLYREIVKFKSGGTVYEVVIENKSRAARRPLPRPKIRR